LAIETYKEALVPVTFVTIILFILFTEPAAGVNPVRAVVPLCVQLTCPAVVTDGKRYPVFPNIVVVPIKLGFAIFYPPNTIEIMKILPLLAAPLPPEIEIAVFVIELTRPLAANVITGTMVALP
jgi:hypothetical protein